MSSALNELYQELILDHYKKPRNFGDTETFAGNHRAEGHNPLCGDNIKLKVKVEGDKISELRFSGSGCAISTAAASLMTEAVKGKSTEEAESMFSRYHAMVTGEGEQPDPETLGKMKVFSEIREFPARVKCATLAWHTLHAALSCDDQQDEQKVTTE